MTIATARTTALQLLGRDTLTLAQWHAAAHRIAHILRTANVHDPAVEAAVTIGQLIIGDTRPAPSRLLEVLPAPHPRHLSPEETRQLHSTLLYATHATTSPNDVTRRLLASVERELLGHPPQRLEATMLQWRRNILTRATSLRPTEAVRIARTQHFLLRIGEDLVGRAEIHGGSGPQRLLQQLRTSAHAWTRIGKHWQQHATENAPPRQHLDQTTFDLQRAMSHVGEQDRLSALLATGFAGNLAAAIAVTPEDLGLNLQHALDLDAHTDLLAHQPLKIPPKPPQPPMPAPRPQPPSGIRHQPDISGPDQPRAHQQPSSMTVARDDVEGHHRLGRIRDAGVIAAAALRGEPDAQQITRNATPQELDQLAKDGESARNGLVMSVIDVLGGRALQQRRILNTVEHEELVQRLGVLLIDAAQKWDPNRATWFSWAHRHMEYAAGQANRAAKRHTDRFLPVEDIASILHRPTDGGGEGLHLKADSYLMPSPEEAIERQAQVDDVLKAIHRLPAQEQQALLRVIQLRSSGTRNAIERTAQELGASTSTVSRRVLAARDQLKADLTTRQRPSSPPGPTPAAKTRIPKTASQEWPERNPRRANLLRNQQRGSSPGIG